MPKVVVDGITFDTDELFPEEFEKEKLPRDPGVYVIIDIDYDDVFYIGEAKDLYSRLNEQVHDGLEYAEGENMNYCIRVKRGPKFVDEDYRKNVERNLKKKFKPTWEEIKKNLNNRK